MKKILSSIVFVLFAVSMQAQINFSTFMNENISWGTKIHPIGEENFIIMGSESYLIIDPSMQVIVPETKLDVPKNSQLLSIYDGVSGGVVAIFRLYVKKEDRYTYSKIIINDDGTIIGNDDIAAVGETKRESSTIKTITSPNGNMHANFIITLDEKKFLKEFIIFILDNEGNITQERTFSPQFANNTFTFHRAYLNDNGTLYFAFSSQQKEKKRKSGTNETFHLLRVDQSGEQFFDLEDIEFGYIENVGILEMENNNLFLGGFYYTDRKKNLPGFFGVIFDTEREDFGTLQSKKIDKFVKPTSSWVNYLGLYEMDNTILLLGEERLVVERRTKDGYYYIYYANEVIICPFDKSGETLTESRIIKGLSSINHQYFLSSSVIQKDNSLYVISNCSHKNELAGKQKGYNLSKGHAKTGTTIHTVSEDGNVEAKKLEAPNLEKMAAIGIVYKDENQVILLYGRPKITIGGVYHPTGFHFKLRKITL